MFFKASLQTSHRPGTCAVSAGGKGLNGPHSCTKCGEKRQGFLAMDLNNVFIAIEWYTP